MTTSAGGMADHLVISSGNPRIDAYLDATYDNLPGMSSRFAAAIVARFLAIQNGMGIRGDIAEIGTFKGRFFIAMMKALAAGERGLGIDAFTWPNAQCYDDFITNCDQNGIDRTQYDVWQTNTQSVTPADMVARLGGRRVRFFHIDGDHSDICLSHDLELALTVLAEDGVLCLDDMLHPGYPTLIVSVMAFLARHPELRVFCIIDRQDIVGAAKFLIARASVAETYETALMQAYPQFHWILGADFGSYGALVLTPQPKLGKVE